MNFFSKKIKKRYNYNFKKVIYYNYNKKNYYTSNYFEFLKN